MYKRQAQATQAAFGSSLLEVTGRGDTPDQRELLAETLGERAGVVAVSMPGDVHDPTSTTAITGSCATLTSLRLPCTNGSLSRTEIDPDPRLDYLAPADWSTTITVTVADPLVVPPSAESVSTSIISYDGSDLPIEALRSDLAHAMLPPPANFPVDDSWNTGLQENRDQARWNAAGAGVLTVLFGLAITAAVQGDVITHARRTGVMSMWGAGRQFVLGVSIIRVFVPLLVAVAAGGAVAYVTTFPYLLPPLDGQLPRNYALTTTVLPLLAAAMITAISALIQGLSLIHISEPTRRS